MGSRELIRSIFLMFYFISFYNRNNVLNLPSFKETLEYSTSSFPFGTVLYHR